MTAANLRPGARPNAQRGEVWLTRSGSAVRLERLVTLATRGARLWRVRISRPGDLQESASFLLDEIGLVRKIGPRTF